VRENDPKFVFIAGTPRSGGSVTLASLDGHLDILAWPFEFFYFQFFREVAGDRETVLITELNQALLERLFKQYLAKMLGHGADLYHEDGPKSAQNCNFNVGDFDYQLFVQRLRATEDKPVNTLDYLAYLFECLKYAHGQYQGKTVKCHMVLTTARGFDWSDENLLGSSLILFSYREAKDSYASLREKYLKSMDFKAFVSLRQKKSSLYWLETYKRISGQVGARANADNFFVVPLQELQKDPEAVLAEICSFLKIEPHPNMSSLTILGSPYQGNAREGNLNQGKIAKHTSKLRAPLTSFEERMFASLNLFNFFEPEKPDNPPFGFFEMVKRVFSSAMSEIPDDKVTIRKNIAPIYIAFGRVMIFFKLCAIHLTSRSKRLAQRVIRKANRHILSMPLWESRTRVQVGH